MAGIVYSNSFLKAFFFDPSPGRDLSFPELRNILLSLDHDSLCTLGSNSAILSSRFHVPVGGEARYVEYIKRLGFRPSNSRMRNKPMNFRLHSVTDHEIESGLIKVERSSIGISVTVPDEMLGLNVLQLWMNRILALTRNYPVGVAKIFEYYEEKGEGTFFYLDISDGGEEHEDDISRHSHAFGYCRNRNSHNIGLIPDSYTLHDLEYGSIESRWRSKEDAAQDYAKRKKQLFWRGSTTGRPPQETIETNRRIQFCIEALNYPDSFDSKITNVVGIGEINTTYKKLLRKKITAAPVTEDEFEKYVAFVDLDGNTAAWGSLRKYLLMVHVIKPESGYTLFYHPTQPRDTFTSVGHESEIFERSKNDPNFLDNFGIAWRGYNFAMELREKVINGEATIFPE